MQQPCVNHASTTICQPCVNHASTTICQPCINDVSTMCQPCVFSATRVHSPGLARHGRHLPGIHTTTPTIQQHYINTTPTLMLLLSSTCYFKPFTSTSLFLSQPLTVPLLLCLNVAYLPRPSPVWARRPCSPHRTS